MGNYIGFHVTKTGISEVAGCASKPLVERPPVLFSFLDDEEGIIGVMTSELLEVFNKQEGRIIASLSLENLETDKQKLNKSSTLSKSKVDDTAEDANDCVTNPDGERLTKNGIQKNGIKKSKKEDSFLVGCYKKNLNGKDICFAALKSKCIFGLELPTLKVVYSISVKDGYFGTSDGFDEKCPWCMETDYYRIKVITCPLNNTILVGLSNGKVLSYYLSTSELAGCFSPSKGLFKKLALTPQQLDVDDNKIDNHTFTSVKTITFSSKRCLVGVGYDLYYEEPLLRYPEFNPEFNPQFNPQFNQPEDDSVFNPDDDVEITSISGVPIVFYSLERQKQTSHYLTSSTIRSLEFTEDGEFVLAVTEGEILFLSVKQHCLLLKKIAIETLIAINFHSYSDTTESSSKNNDDSLTKSDLNKPVADSYFGLTAVSCNMPKKLLLMALKGGRVVVLRYSASYSSPDNSQFHMKLLRCLELRNKSDTTSMLLLTQSQWDIQTIFIDGLSESVAVGDGVGRVKICWDIVGHNTAAEAETKLNYKVMYSAAGRDKVNIAVSHKPSSTRASESLHGHRNPFLLGGVGDLPSDVGKHDDRRLPLISLSTKLTKERPPPLPRSTSPPPAAHLPLFSLNPSGSIESSKRRAKCREEVPLPGQSQ